MLISYNNDVGNNVSVSNVNTVIYALEEHT